MKFCLKNLKEGDHLKDLGVDGWFSNGFQRNRVRGCELYQFGINRVEWWDVLNVVMNLWVL
jgi:hypothetical protein